MSVADYVFFLVFSSLLSFLHYPVYEGSFYARYDQLIFPVARHVLILVSLPRVLIQQLRPSFT